MIYSRTLPRLAYTCCWSLSHAARSRLYSGNWQGCRPILHAYSAESNGAPLLWRTTLRLYITLFVKWQHK